MIATHVSQGVRGIHRGGGERRRSSSGGHAPCTHTCNVKQNRKKHQKSERRKETNYKEKGVDGALMVFCRKGNLRKRCEERSNGEGTENDRFRRKKRNRETASI